MTSSCDDKDKKTYQLPTLEQMRAMRGLPQREGAKPWTAPALEALKEEREKRGDTGQTQDQEQDQDQDQDRDQGGYRLPTLEQMLALRGGEAPDKAPKPKPRAVLIPAAGSQQEEQGSYRLPTLEQLQRLHGAKKPERAPEKNQGPEADPQLMAESYRQTQLECEKLLENAKAEAQAHRQALLQEIEAQRQTVFDAARLEAYNEGAAEARRELEKLERQLEEKYKKAAEGFARQAGGLFDQVRDNIVSTAVRIAAKIMRAELDRDDDMYKGMALAVIGEMLDKKPVQLRVSTWEYNRFFQPGNPFRKQLEQLCDGMEILEGPTLKKGDFTVVSDTDTVSAGINVQLEQMERALQNSESE